MVSLVVALSGCYITKIRSGQPDPRLETYSATQVFLIAGLVPISSEAGAECPHGVSYAESEVSFVDGLVTFIFSLSGTLAAGIVCANSTPGECTAATFGGSLLPLIIATRTVRYQCARRPPVMKSPPKMQSSNLAVELPDDDDKMAEWMDEAITEARRHTANALRHGQNEAQP